MSHGDRTTYHRKEQSMKIAGFSLAAIAVLLVTLAPAADTQGGEQG